jgi:HD-like signal output (HDOD) protein
MKKTRGERMKIECFSCGKVYNLPDGSLDSYTKKTIKCPACKSDISLDFLSTENLDNENKQISADDSEILPSDDLRHEISKAIKDLEPMPEVIHKARDVMSKPNATFKEIGKVIETDQAIVAKVLKIANSAYYGMSGRVSSIHQALVVLGYETLEQVISTAWTSKMFAKTMEGYGSQAGALWNHSLAVAIGARVIAAKRKPVIENDAFTCGLLHDVGKLALDEFILKNKNTFDRLRKETNSSRKAEEVLFGFDHSEISSLICEEWNLPEDQVLAIQYHHDPLNSPENELAYFLYIADHMAWKCGFGTGVAEATETIDNEILETYDFKEEDLDPLMDEIKESVENISKSVL